MALREGTIKIIAIVVIITLVIGGVVGLLLVLLLPSADNSGLVFLPKPEEGTLIYYKASNRDSILKWVNSIDDFLNDYRSRDSPGAENRVSCSYESGPLGKKQVCNVPVDDFHPCVHSNEYNYRKAAPCVFLKLNDVLDWKPTLYNLTKDLPDNMPEDLKEYIKSISGRVEANTIWVSCAGETPADVENIGPIQYIPRRGFPAYYYPFTNKEGYLSPLVAVLFERPRTDIVINIECKAWAKNIFFDRYERRGSVHFELMVDRG